MWVPATIHVLENGNVSRSANGYTVKKGIWDGADTVPRVYLPGTTMYEDSSIQREEFVRLVLQSLRDIGYMHAADTLEAESGYQLESSLVSGFRYSILGGRWDEAEEALEDLGVQDEDEVKSAKFMIRQQKYLESLEARQTDVALRILRNELAPLRYNLDRLHLLSSFMMCSSNEDLRSRAKWSGSLGGSRAELLGKLQRTVPPSVMIPPRRLEALLNQAQDTQRRSCLYHNTRAPFSLLIDHDCGRAQFPGVTTNVLAEHDDEVWNVEWSPDGKFLASGGTDQNVFIWRIGARRECHVEHVLRDFDGDISALAWSNDGTMLLTAADKTVKLWIVKTGVCSKEITDHTDIVGSLKWLPDNSGFVTTGMDAKLFFYVRRGDKGGNHSTTEPYMTKVGLRMVDIAISPNGRYLLAVGQPHEARGVSNGPLFDLPVGVYATPSDDYRAKRTQLMVFDRETDTRFYSQIRIGDMTSVKISADSKLALINFAPNVVFLWDIEGLQLVRRYVGHQHTGQVLRSCFGGSSGSWIVAGGEDALIHVWHRETSEVLEVLGGHKHGSVNSVVWNPVDDGVFASCSDDGTVRIWEAPTWTFTGGRTANMKAPLGARVNGFHLEDTSVSQEWT
ncbi:WD40 repeat-like protein [Cantharellus anzutake]|uniref:WD40 repeat-like protein n=1 Tax=Cantharellus anzutake TaxID=1750568 RepID=UPI0019070337|nr:WD40 repeat-like protein [Cantharellus anzutake]KAF8334203.1 WD40 repeat-like protein [Cantharellus anzutake]